MSGKFTRMRGLNGHDDAELLERVASLEARSERPIGQAILEYARERGVSVSPATDFQIVPGRGAMGHFNGEPYWLGSHRYLEERRQETEEVHHRLVTLSAAGRTVVVVGNERHVCGFITLADAVRPTATQTVQALRQAGVSHLVMLTGDNEATAQAIAQETGVDEVHAELLPADKVAAVESLVSRYGSVAMVGDGVNDAPALARATLGVAMGTAGTDAAIETADVALMADDLTRLPWLVRHSRRTLAIIRQNIAPFSTLRRAWCSPSSPSSCCRTFGEGPVRSGWGSASRWGWLRGGRGFATKCRKSLFLRRGFAVSPYSSVGEPNSVAKPPAPPRAAQCNPTLPR
jgi:Cd2+/Zn2+-exporting ATPase